MSKVDVKKHLNPNTLSGKMQHQEFEPPEELQDAINASGTIVGTLGNY